MAASRFLLATTGRIAHITAADGEDNMAFLDIQEGPYLVQPTSEAFDNGERSINVDESNLVWLNANDIEWVSEKSNVETAFLWGGSHEKNQLRATLIKLPAGFKGKIKNLSTNFRAVVISGVVTHQFSRKMMKIYWNQVLILVQKKKLHLLYKLM